jgi:hypothetical protein
MNSAIVSDPLRATITATRQDDGRILVRAANRFLLFTDAEIKRLAEFSTGRATIQRFPAAQ